MNLSNLKGFNISYYNSVVNGICQISAVRRKHTQLICLFEYIGEIHCIVSSIFEINFYANFRIQFLYLYSLYFLFCKHFQILKHVAKEH